ncbi:MAG: type secretion system domain protein [Bacillales bacterium]|jgi:type II secretory pathway component PulF|nr:type secretion system domain protein [Bacillales bacterium]
MKSKFVYQRWSLDKQLTFIKRLEFLVKNGHSLAEGIRLLSSFYKGNYLKDVLKIDHLSREGRPLSEIFEVIKFRNEIITLFYLSNENSTLAELLNKARLILEQKQRVKKLLIKTLSYPIFLLLFTIAVLNFFHTFLLPQYNMLFNQFNSNKPIMMSLLINIIEYIPFAIVLIIIFLFLFLLLSNRKKLADTYIKIQKFFVRLPILGTILKKRYSYFFSLFLSTFIARGISFIDCFEIIRNSKNVAISHYANVINLKLYQGVSLSSAFEDATIFEENLIEVLRTSQMSGELIRQLSSYSALCVEELELLIKNVLIICQTIIYIVVLLFIIITYYSILTPLYSMLEKF